MLFRNGQTCQALTGEGTVSYSLGHLTPQNSSENLEEVTMGSLQVTSNILSELIQGFKKNVQINQKSPQITKYRCFVTPQRPPSKVCVIKLLLIIPQVL